MIRVFVLSVLCSSSGEARFILIFFPYGKCTIWDADFFLYGEGKMSGEKDQIEEQFRAELFPEQ